MKRLTSVSIILTLIMSLFLAATPALANQESANGHLENEPYSGRESAKEDPAHVDPTPEEVVFDVAAGQEIMTTDIELQKLDLTEEAEAKEILAVEETMDAERAALALDLPEPKTIDQIEDASIQSSVVVEITPDWTYRLGYNGETNVAMHIGKKGKTPRYEFSLRKWLEEVDDVIHLSGDLREDIIAVAQSQLGYYEDASFKRTEGEGYTRYGEWYGWMFSDWCDMFVSFCINYAGLIDYPFEVSCMRHMFNLKEAGYWRAWNNYIPQRGDIVFLNIGNNTNGAPTHVGIIERVVPATDTHPAYLHTIEGNIGIGEEMSGVGRERRYFENVVGYGTYEEGERLPREYSRHFGDRRDVDLIWTPYFTDYPTVEALDFIGMGGTPYFDAFFGNGIDDINDAIEKERAMTREAYSKDISSSTQIERKEQAEWISR